MRSDDVACAHCGGIVANGGCPVCRITREELDRQRFAVPAPLIAFLAVLIALMLVVVAHHAG
jgi:hypothetical protein